MWTCCQREERGVTPVAASIRNHGWRHSQYAILINRDDGVRFCCPAQRRRGVIRGFVFHITRDRSNVIVNSRNNRYVRKVQRRVGDDKACTWAGVPRGIRGGHLQRGGIQLCRAERNGEIATGGNAGAEDSRTVCGIHGDGGSRFSGPGKRGALLSKGEVGWVCRNTRIDGYRQVRRATRNIACGIAG